MKARSSSPGICLIAAFMAVAGCQGAVNGGDVDALADGNNNGFLDIMPPSGVAFNDESNAKMILANSIGDAEMAMLAAEQGVSPSVLNLVTFQVNLVLVLEYTGFETLTLRQRQSLAPFERRLEAACPDFIQVEVTVTAQVPVVGPQVVYDGYFELSQGVQFDCGETMTIATLVDENGNPQVDVSALRFLGELDERRRVLPDRP